MSNPVKSVSSQLDRIEQLLDQHNVRKAVDTLESIKFTADASGERLIELLKRTASIATDTNVPLMVVRAARQLQVCKVPSIVVATLYAKVGDLIQARAALGNDISPENEAFLLAHVIDWNISTRKTSTIPEEYRPAADLFLKALKAYDSKDNAGAREILQAIGATSPLLEWKLFLRGLMAWTESDDLRAGENFRRLNPDRLPARLAAVLNDPAQMAKATPNDGDLGKLILDWRKAIAKQQPFAPLFRNFKRQLPSLPEQQKTLLPRLARCYYAEIQYRGHPDDMRAYKEVFGSPPLDPDFDRLQSIKMERLGQLTMAQKQWGKYATWVAKTMPWPKPINDMVLAIIKNTEGELAHDVVDEPGFDVMEEVYRMMKLGQKGLVLPKKDKELTKADAIRFWLESHRLAPDWSEPLTNLLHAADTEPLLDQTSKLCEEYLQRKPDDYKLREQLSYAYLEAKRYTESKRHLQIAYTLNPLDAALGTKYESVQLIELVTQFGKESLPSIHTALLQFREQKKQIDAVPFDIIQYVLETLDGGTTVVRLDASLRVCVELMRVIVSVLYKSKPAVRTKIKAAFTESAENEADTVNLIKALNLLQLFKSADVKFTGAGVIEKQLMSLFGERLLAEKQIELVEEAVIVTVDSGISNPQVKTLLKKLTDKYKHNLLLDVYEFDYLLKNSKKEPNYRDRGRLFRLTDECTRSNVARFQALKPKLEAMKEQYGIDLDFGW